VKVVVVGGGVAGLTCALALADRGHEVTCLEREAAAGGKVGTARVNDGAGQWLVERGPAGVLDNSPPTQELYQRLNLSSEVVISDDAARKRFLMRGRRLRLVPASPAILFSSVLPWSAKWRLIREPKAPPPPAGVDETVAEFARRRLGDEIAAGLAEPMVSGVFAGDYSRLSIASAFPRVVEMERTHGSLLRAMMAMEKARKADGRPREPVRLTSLRGGMGSLPAALAGALGDRLRTKASVHQLLRSGSGWTVQTDAGPLSADRVVLALPSDEAAELVKPIDAALSDAYSAIPLAGVVAVALGWARADVKHPLDGFGFLVPRREGVRVLGSIWMSSTFPSGQQAPDGHVLLRCMLGGAHDPAALELSDDELVAAAREALGLAIGLTIPPRFVNVQRWRRGIAQYEVGHAGRVATIEERARALGLLPTGSALRGVGVNDVIREARAAAERLTAE
jgi:protoporphyrinogen/coproporphyrinogen III oxidase